MTLRGAVEEEALLHSRNNKEGNQYVDFSIGRCGALYPLALCIRASVCGAEAETSRVLHLCRKGGGRVYMDVSAAKSDVINVVVA